jgi:hypothetical protein
VRCPFAHLNNKPKSIPQQKLVIMTRITCKVKLDCTVLYWFRVGLTYSCTPPNVRSFCPLPMLGVSYTTSHEPCLDASLASPCQRRAISTTHMCSFPHKTSSPSLTFLMNHLSTTAPAGTSRPSRPRTS